MLFLAAVLAPGASVLAGPAAGAAGPSSAAGGSTGPGPSSSSTFTLADQTPAVVGPTSPVVRLTLGIGPQAPAGAAVEVALYRKLDSRSEFEQVVQRGPSSDSNDPQISGPATVPVSSLTVEPNGGSLLQVTIGAGAVGSASPGLSISCTLGEGLCSGVYPLVVSLVSGSEVGATVLGKFTTFVTYNESSAPTPIEAALVLPAGAPVAIHHQAREPGSAVESPTTAQESALRGLAGSLSLNPNVPVTVETVPQTLQAMARPPTSRTSNANRSAISELAALSRSGDHQFLDPSFVPINLGALAGAGETTEVEAQLKQGLTVLQHSLGIQPSTGNFTWLASGAVGSDLATGLQTASQATGFASTADDRLVLPDVDLAPPSNEQFTWTWTFSVGLGKGTTVTAAAADSELASHFDSQPNDPALEATQLLADLAVIQSERPSLKDRGVVIVPPAGWTPNATFDNELLAGLDNNPVVKPVTLDTYFDQVPADPTNAANQTRHLSSGGVPTMPKALARQFSSARLRLTALQGVVLQPALITELNDLLLCSESSDLHTASQFAGLATLNRAVDDQLDQVQIANERTVTLTSRTGSIPITVSSAAPYPVRGTLTLSSPKLIFSQSPTRTLTLDRATTSVRFQVEARTSGDLPVVATFASANGKLVISRAQMTVRSTATSLVGIILTVVALVVLAGWWGRTVWNGRRRRRAVAASRAGHGQ